MTTEIFFDTSSDSLAFLNSNQSYCDWRIDLSCEDGRIYKSLYTLNFVIISLITVACIILLWYRISRQRCTIFSPKISGTGFIRPNPVEGFLVWAILWLIGRILFIIILWSGKFENNYLVLETLQELYWTCCLTGYAWFVAGTYLQIGSHLNSKQRPWRPNNKLSDGYLLLMTVIAPITIWPIAVAGGYFRDNGNIKVADILTSVRLLLWSLWNGCGAVGAFYFGRELCSVLSHHISVAKESNHIAIGRIEKMQSGLKKIKFTLHIILSTYIYFALYCLTSSLFRIWIIIHSKPLSVFMFITYTFFNPLCILIVVATISIRIIQGCKRESTITKKLIGDSTDNNNDDSNNDNNNNNNTKFHHKRLSAHLAIPLVNNNRNRSNTNGHTELDSITSAIAVIDQHQFDDLDAYTQFNTNVNDINTSNSVNIKIQTDKRSESGSGFNKKNDHVILKKPEKIVVRPASPTIPIYSNNQKYI